MPVSDCQRRIPGGAQASSNSSTIESNVTARANKTSHHVISSDIVLTCLSAVLSEAEAEVDAAATVADAVVAAVHTAGEQAAKRSAPRRKTSSTLESTWTRSLPSSSVAEEKVCCASLAEYKAGSEFTDNVQSLVL